MTSPTTLQSQTLSRSGSKPKPAEGEEAGMKPKKANSEVRKQQNRIASRNYREKRKRKLQYLRQLIEDGPNNEHELEPSPEPHGPYARSFSTDYEPSAPSSSPYILPSNSDFGSLSSSNAMVSEPILAASGASFDSHPIATTQAYDGFGANWNAPLYSPSPLVNVSTWTIPPWMPSIDYTPQAPSYSAVLHYTTPSGPPVFAQAHAASQQPRALPSDTNYYAFGSSYGSQSQDPGIPNVSLPTSSPYYQELYPGPH